jgi:hypothetical protein
MVGVAVGVEVAVLVGKKVIVAVGVTVASRRGTAGKLLHPDNKKTTITPHTRIIPQTAFEILRVSFMSFLLVGILAQKTVHIYYCAFGRKYKWQNDLAGKSI